MHRFRSCTVLLAIVWLLLLAGFIAPPIAQGTAPDAVGGHPVVGTWLMDGDADDLDNAPEVVIFTADGGYISVDAEGLPSLGVWKATGERTAVLNLVSTGVEEDGAFAGTFVIRATVEVDAPGDSLAVTYTGEFILADGTKTGELGPSTATATRIVVEPMGTPEGPFPDLFESDDEGTPAT